MCGYCDGGNKEIMHYDIPAGIDLKEYSAYIDGESVIAEMNSFAHGNEEIQIPANFCLMCGRDLRSE